MSAPSGLSHWKTQESLKLGAILLVTAIVCARALFNGFALDDQALIVNNIEIGNWSFLWKALTREEFWYVDAHFWLPFRNYRPLLLFWFWLDYHLFGLDAPFWHASIVAAHLVVVWLVFKVGKDVTGDSNSALLAALLFGLIPIHAQTVAWIASCGLMLATALELAAFHLFVHRARAGARNLAVAAVLYAGALLCHETAAVFPAIVALYAFLLEPSGPNGPSESAGWRWADVRRALVCAAPFAIELLVYLLVVRWLVLGFVIKGSTETANVLTRTQDVLTVPLVFVTYLTLLVAPWLALPDHQTFPVSSAASPQFWMPLAAMVLVAAALVLIWQRSPRRKFYLFCAGWLGLSLAPAMVLPALYILVQDMYLYFPSIGWCILLADLAVGLSRQNLVARRLALAASAALLAVYAIALWRVEPIWHDDVSLARGDVEGFPESVAWHQCLATYLDRAGDHAGAEREYRTALSLVPDRTGTNNFGPVFLHWGLGELLANRGDLDGAMHEFSASRVAQSPATQPAPRPAGHFERAGQLQASGDLAGAERELDADLRLNPNDGRALYARGLLDAKLGRVAEGAGEIERALRMVNDPPAQAYVSLLDLYDRQGNQAKGAEVLARVESMPRGDEVAGMVRADLRIERGDLEGAERILRPLADRHPDLGEVRSTLGLVQVRRSEYEEALASFHQALAHNAGSPNTHFYVAQVLHAMGRDRDALDQCRLALALWPDNKQFLDLKDELEQSPAVHDH